ncbi:hypothetical protein M9458_035470, partial [Cirrhinus mrigala]
ASSSSPEEPAPPDITPSEPESGFGAAEKLRRLKNGLRPEGTGERGEDRAAVSTKKYCICLLFSLGDFHDNNLGWQRIRHRDLGGSLGCIVRK